MSLKIKAKRWGVHPGEKEFTARGSSSSTRRRWFRLSPIDQYSRLLPPVGVRPVSQCLCWGTGSHLPYPS